MLILANKFLLRGWASPSRLYIWNAFFVYHEAMLDALICDGEIPIAECGDYEKMIIASSEKGLGDFDGWSSTDETRNDDIVHNGLMVSVDNLNSGKTFGFRPVKRALGLPLEPRV